MNDFDPYLILGIDDKASPEDIKKAYRDLAKLYHPDVQETGDADKFNEMKRAYDTLSDPAKFELFSQYGIISGDPNSELLLKAINNLKLLFFNIMSQVHPDQLETFDLIKTMNENVNQHKAEYLKKQMLLKENLAQNARILAIFDKRLTQKKTTGRKTPNFFMDTIKDSLVILPQQIAQIELEMRVTDKMMEVLLGFSYDFIRQFQPTGGIQGLGGLHVYSFGAG